METYKNFSGKSGVLGFEIRAESITVWFKGGKRPYNYSYFGKAGEIHVENMKTLALNGSGLNSYIKTNVNNSYD